MGRFLRPLGGGHCAGQRADLCFRWGANERAFADHLAPSIARCSSLYHCAIAVVVATVVCVAIVQVGGEDVEGESGHTDALKRLGGLAVAHALLALAMAMERPARRLQRRIPWEAVSAMGTALLCAMYPWVGVQLPGVAPRETEILAFLAVLVVLMGFQALVPTRFVWWPVLPLSALASDASVAAVVGLAAPGAAPMRLAALALLLFLSVGNGRRRERFERRCWREAQVVADRQRVPQSDITLHLTEAGLLTRTTAELHDRLFGRRSEALSFPSLLTPIERVRLQEGIEQAEISMRPVLLGPCTLTLPQGVLWVHMNIAREMCDGEPLFSVGLRVVRDESPQSSRPSQRSRTPPPMDSGFPRLRSDSSGPQLSPVLPGTLADPEAHRATLSDPGRGSEGGTLWLSESSCHVARVSTQSVGTQTKGSMADACVSTTMVIDGLSFRCTLCSKPPVATRTSSSEFAPVIPGPEAQALIAKLDRQKGVARRAPAKSKKEMRPYAGRDFDGIWAADVGPERRLNDVLRRICISSGLAMLADGTGVYLQSDEAGRVVLIGGELSLRRDGRMLRVGRQGGVVEFAPLARGASHGSKDSARGSPRRAPGSPDRRYTGRRFDGMWEAAGPAEPWMRRICIFGGRVALADGSESWLAQPERGAVCLRGGELQLLDHGRLVRLGRHGRAVEFILAMPPSDSESEEGPSR